jgi:HK97 family phage portal protein
MIRTLIGGLGERLKRVTSQEGLADYGKGDPRQMLLSVLGRNPPDKSRQALLERYAGWAHICASRNGSALASIPLNVYATRSAGQDQARRGMRRIGFSVSKSRRRELAARYRKAQTADDVEQLTEHPILDLLAAANPVENGFELMERTSIFLDCTGDAYWMLAGTPVPTELYLLPSQWETVVPDKERLVKGYVYGSDPRTQVRFEPEDVMHFRMPNPLSLYYGLGCIEAALLAVDRYRAMDEYERALNENMGVPSLAISYKGGKLTAEKRKEAELAWNNALRGVRKAGQIKVMDYEWDVKELSTKPREMGFSDGRRWTRLEIADAFGVPLAMLDTENVNLANARSALYQYMKFTVLPRLRRIEQVINERLVPLYKEPRLFVAFDNPVPSEEELEAKLNETYLRTQVYTVNEVRGRMGLDPVEWGDEPLSPTPSAFSVGGASDMDSEDDEKRAKASKQVAIGHVPPLTARQRKLRDALRDVFQRQRDAVLAGMKSQRKAGIDWDADTWNAAIDQLTRPLIADEMKTGARRAASQLSARRIDFGLAEYVSGEVFANHARTQTLKFAVAVNRQTERDLRRALAEAMDAGETLSELQVRVSDIFKGYEDYRAERIARTESARATTGGALDAYKESGVVEATQWNASPDACQFCLAMDGKAVKLGEVYAPLDSSLEVDGQTMSFDYAEVDAPPLHPNCVTAETPVLAPGKIAGIIAAYRGPIVEIGFADGRWLSVTPNHMLLTPHGFTPAQFLAEGDDVLGCADFQRVVFRNPHDDRLPARIDEVVKSLSETPGMSTMRVPVAAEYLHGDAQGCGPHAYINVIWPNRPPTGDVHMPMAHKLRSDHLFSTPITSGYSDSATFSTQGSLAQFLHAAALASDCTMGRRREALAFAGARLRHPERHGFAPIPRSHIQHAKALTDSAARVPEVLGQFLDAHPGVVEPQKIARINVVDRMIHVFDLHCFPTVYICNGVLSSNCRCDIIPVLVKEG